jgi:hypothetical protein
MTKKSAATHGWAWPSALDALVAAPKYHKLLFENDKVRVMEVTIPPGETVPLHTHCWPSVLYLMSFAHFIRRDERGNMLADSRRDDPPPVPCATWAEPYPPHTLQNMDDVEMRGISVELKK